MARQYGFQGLDFWGPTNSSDDMSNLGILFEEWRAAINLEARNSAEQELILTASVTCAPRDDYSVDSIQQQLDWVHVRGCGELWPNNWPNFTAAPNALYSPNYNDVYTINYSITAWINAGLSAKKIVMILPYFGMVWRLVNPKENGIGAPAAGKGTGIGIRYHAIKNKINLNGAKVIFDERYVVNYCSIGTSWVAFDDVEAIQHKVSYAKEKGLLGYFVWQVSYDDNWVLSQSASQDVNINGSAPVDGKNGENKSRRLLAIILITIAAAVILLILCSVLFHCWMRNHKTKGNLF
ncbi:hypothetical protein EZV62_007966 [Acer yangbiense]|uniref:GH18 domain-containing protein n=1 Tax=Acer yangbiense TaxID=1000413 RepID=A0A5C7IC21_9ROSI|nr:hypothetical protein EZV62_007966 [Acer yangbiense]